MGYTHYWTQIRDLTPAEWAVVQIDVAAILVAAEDRGIALAGGDGAYESAPEFHADFFKFNGVGCHAHEPMGIHRVRSAVADTQTHGQQDSGMCKTHRRPYDLAVTACLCYLSQVSESHDVTSNGHGEDFFDGLALARQALPHRQHRLDIPHGVMQKDRWCGPWIYNYQTSGFKVRFCVDGRAYVMRVGEAGQQAANTYVFPTHRALAEFLDAHKSAAFKKGGRMKWGGSYEAIEPDIWNATGSFDTTRHARIAAAQAKALRTLFPVPLANQGQPPSFVRPNEYPPPAEGYAHYVKDLLQASA